MEYDAIIVGAGMAGLTAAIYLIRAGKSVLVLESGVIGGQIVSSLMVGNWPGDKKVSGKDLMGRIHEQVNELGVEIKYEEVMEIKEDKERFTVITDEEKYGCGAIIIATGTKPRKMSDMQTKSAGSRPISYCATCDGALYKDRPVVVVGSGNTARHEISYLEGICSKVYHIHHDEPIPEEAEAVFVAIGRVPATQFLKSLVDLDSDGYVLANEDCVTSYPGIFVAGDCRTKTTRQLVTAAADGAIAANAVIDFLGQ